jgi:(E)-4-hydroxy-3-methyl-but-2-enyl pyrophosphate reductase
VSNRKRIIVAESAGFCWGVSRAFDKVMEIAERHPDRKPVYTYGPLIHNPLAVDMLEQKGIRVLKEIPATLKGTLVIRTHGVPPAERRKIEQCGASICDATCPDVGKIQGTVRAHLHQGYFIIIMGDREHPEVKALLGFAEKNGACVISEEEIERLPGDLGKVCVVSQSTQQRKKFEELLVYIQKRYPDCIVFDTICRSTSLRQEEVRKLASQVNAMVVVGGRNSSNTNRLAEISNEMGAPTFLIESDDELDFDELSKFDTIGVTAGASTPRWVIEKVVARLEEMIA